MKIEESKNFIFRPFNFRIGNLSISNYCEARGSIFPRQSHSNSNFSQYEILKWEANPYFSKELEFIDKGYSLSEDGKFLTLLGHSISTSLFQVKETSILLADWIDLFTESGPNLVLRGSCLKEMTDEDFFTFSRLSRIGREEIVDQIRKIREEYRFREDPCNEFR